MRPPATIAALLAVFLCGACDFTHRVGAKITPGLADRCAEIMEAAMPFAEMELDKRTAEGTGLRTVTAHAAGTRTNAPEGTDRAVAADCQFEDSILTGFSWVK